MVLLDGGQWYEEATPQVCRLSGGGWCSRAPGGWMSTRFGHRVTVAPASQAKGSGAGLGERIRTMCGSAGKPLPWLPLVGVAFGLLFVFFNIVFVVFEWAPPVTWPYPAAAAAPLAVGPLATGQSRWTSAHGRGNGMKFPGVTPAVLSVELISLDIANRTISARLSLIFTGSLVSHLQFASVSHRELAPLTEVPPQMWAKLPVDIRLISCGRVRSSGSCPPIASIPLGQLDPYGRGGSGSVQTAVTLPLLGWPDRFPQDTYVLTTTPEVSFPNDVSLVTRAAGSPATPGHGFGGMVPAKTVITADAGLGGHTLTVIEGSSGTRPLVVGLLIGRPISYRITRTQSADMPGRRSRRTCVGPPGGNERGVGSAVRPRSHRRLDRGYARNPPTARCLGANRHQRPRPDPAGLHSCV